MKYHYSVVRFCPDPLRGEFVNVAIIAGSDDGRDWDYRRMSNERHARSLGGGSRLGAVWRYLDRVAEVIAPAANDKAPADTAPASPSHRWLTHEHETHRNLVQLTSPVPVVAQSAQEAINSVFDLYVVDPLKTERSTRSEAQAALRRAFLDIKLPAESLHQRVTASVGRQRAVIDFAIANGHLVQLAHAWSFQQKEPHETVQQIKAWSWTVRDLRDHGGLVRTREPKQDYPVDRDVEIGITYTEPDSDAGRRSLEEALEVFDGLHVRAVSTRDAYIVAADAVDALARETDKK
jgi:hypothetical protein